MTELSDPELSKTAFERTLLMEERTKMLRDLQKRNQTGGNGSPSPYSTIVIFNFKTFKNLKYKCYV